MKLLFITLFPEFIKSNFSYSILARAQEKKVIDTFFINPRDFTTDKHKTVDDTPFGGGFGMVLKAEPFIKSIQKAKSLLPNSKVILLVPDGCVFNQSLAKDLSNEQELVFVCGHYEGFDERIKQFVDFGVSVGDYVLTGGELPAMVISDAVCRLLPGVLGKIESVETESFSDGLLEYPQYTRPAESEFGNVPDVLLSGHHVNIARWRRKEMLKNTYLRRPELLKSVKLQPDDGNLLLEIITEQTENKND